MFDKMKQMYQMKKMMEGITSTEDYKGIKTPPANFDLLTGK